MELVGREAELVDVGERLSGGVRLVTLVGPGGIGKTSLARRALGDLVAPADNHGVVELSGVDRPEAVASSLAAQLGYPGFDALAASDVAGVVLVDNCEHVLDAAADAIGVLLDRCRELTVLATSRSPLELPGESLVALAPLDVPPDGTTDRSSASVRLFEARARDAGVPIDAGDAELVAALCRRLDGVPLAIELAAARLRSMSPGELLVRLGDGIDVLTRSRRRGMAHHRSVRETIEWSVALLDAGDRSAFARLGVCPGWFDVELAASLIAGTASSSAGAIERLVDASLLAVDRRTTSTRYRMLEPVRAVAVDLLVDLGGHLVGLERLADHLVATALVRIERSRTSMAAEAAAEAVEHFEQFDLALRHCVSVDDDPRRARVLYAILWGIVQQARLDDVLALGEGLFDRWPDLAGPGGADAASVLATARLFTGDLAGARALALGAIEHEHGSLFAPVAARRALAHAARFDGDHDEAARWFESAADAGFEHDIPTLAIASVAFRAQDVAAHGRFDEALELVGEAIAAAADLHSPLTELLVRSIEATILAAGDATQRALAADLAKVSLDAAADSRYPVATLANLQTLTVCAHVAGDVGGAARWATRLVESCTRAGPGDLRRALELSAAVLAAAGDDDARHLAATAASLPATSPMTLTIDLPSLAPGVVLDRSAAQRLARVRLASLAAEPSGTSARADAASEPVGANTFVKVGDAWQVAYEGVAVIVTPSKGMDDLHLLLSRPGREVHCVELAGAAVEQSTTGEVIDATARRRYEDRIRELQAEIDEAEEMHDHGRAEVAQAEFDAVVEHLSAAMGVGGRTRTSGGTTERARSTVTHRIRTAVRRIGEVHPAAGDHLDRSITTGVYCRYEPDRPLVWTLSSG